MRISDWSSDVCSSDLMLVQTERRHRVEVITINRPEARNAIDYDTSQALADAFDAAVAAPEVWAVVLTGAGDKAFSAGLDLKAFAGGELGRASCRASVCQYVTISEVAVTLKKQQQPSD